MTAVKRVAIIGAGSSGLTAIKACLEEDQLPLCLEKTIHLGGLWNYSEKPSAPNTAGIYSSLVINTSREMMAFSDFPIPEDFPQFLTHENVLRYFCMYAVHFGLLPYIRFNTEVRHVRRADDYLETGRYVVTYVTHTSDSCMWKCIGDIELKDKARHKNADETVTESCCDQTQGDQAKSSVDSVSPDGLEASEEKACREVSEEFDGVMVCTGHHTVPYLPSLPGMRQFQGQIIHSQQYKRPEPFRNQRVLVVGIGNSAVDIASDLAKTAGKVFLSTRRGSWIVARSTLGGIPSDMLANSRVMFSFPPTLLQWCVEKQANSRMNHDQLGLTPGHRLLAAHPTINDEIPVQLMTGRVEVRPNVAHILTREVQFQDGGKEKVDTIIMATGYDYRVDFIEPEVLTVRDNHVDLFKYVFPPNLAHATLSVIGLVQAIGALMPISELQSRWAVNVLLGRVKLPAKCVMEEDINRKHQDVKAKYYASRRHTIQTFWIQYMDEIAEQIKARPNLLRLLWKDPGLALRCYFGPCLPAQYRLQGPHPWSHAPIFIREVWERLARRPCRIRNPRMGRSSGCGTNADVFREERGDTYDDGSFEEAGLSAATSAAPSSYSQLSVSGETRKWCGLHWSWRRLLYLTYGLLMSVCCVLWLRGVIFTVTSDFRRDL